MDKQENINLTFMVRFYRNNTIYNESWDESKSKLEII